MNDIEQAMLILVRGVDKMIRAAIREELAATERAMPRIPESAWLDEEAVAERLCISRATLQSWRYSAKGPPFTKIGRLVRYRLTDVEAWLAKQRRGGAVEPVAVRTKRKLRERGVNA
jgi:predicted DNA-binding transcriptional regulator AlpA